MVEKRTLEDVLADLKAAEKEYNEKCLKYGIKEKHKRKKDDEVVENQDSIGEEMAEESISENSIEQVEEKPIIEEISEN